MDRSNEWKSKVHLKVCWNDYGMDERKEEDLSVGEKEKIKHVLGMKINLVSNSAV